MLLRKAKHWEYEEEWRVFRTGPELGIERYPAGMLARVILGCQLSRDDREVILDLAAALPAPPEIYQAQRSKSAFALELSRIDIPPPSRKRSVPNTGKAGDGRGYPMGRVLIAAMIAVALCDILSALATRPFGFHFGWRGPFLLVIYVIAGYSARRVAGLRAAMVVGLTSATVDSIGAVVWAMGSGRLPDQYNLPSPIAMAILIPVFGALLGALGGLFAPSPSPVLPRNDYPASRAPIFSVRSS
jgi:hypothetical protein